MRDRTGEWRHTAQADRLGPLVVAIPLAAVILTAFSIESGRSLPIVGALALAIGVALVMRPRLAVVAMALCWGGAIAITWQTSFDQLQPAELDVIATAFARIDEAFGPEGRCPGT